MRNLVIALTVLGAVSSAADAKYRLPKTKEGALKAMQKLCIPANKAYKLSENEIQRLKQKQEDRVPALMNVLFGDEGKAVKMQIKSNYPSGMFEPKPGEVIYVTGLDSMSPYGGIWVKNDRKPFPIDGLTFPKAKKK